MHQIGLKAVRLVRTPSFVRIIMSCAPCIQRSAFRSIGNREIFNRPPLAKIIGCRSVVYRLYAFCRTESREIGQNAFLVYNNNVLRLIHTTICILGDWKP